MIRLLYLSQAKPGISDAQVQDILLASQRNNAANGITGVLVYGGGTFMQVLEGAELSVLRLYVKILDDARHGDCRIIHISPANERIFQKWSMGMIHSDPLGFEDIAGLRAHRLEAVHAKAFTEAMRAFVRQLDPGVDAASGT
jgi:hypothetical protein